MNIEAARVLVVGDNRDTSAVPRGPLSGGGFGG